MPDKFVKNIKQIINPRKDFLLADDLLKNPKIMRAVRERIFAELVEHLRRWKSCELIGCSMGKNGRSGRLEVKKDDEK